jgi:hypothetical protein
VAHADARPRDRLDRPVPPGRLGRTAGLHRPPRSRPLQGVDHRHSASMNTPAIQAATRSARAPPFPVDARSIIARTGAFARPLFAFIPGATMPKARFLALVPLFALAACDNSPPAPAKVPPVPDAKTVAPAKSQPSAPRCRAA